MSGSTSHVVTATTSFDSSSVSESPLDRSVNTASGGGVIFCVSDANTVTNLAFSRSLNFSVIKYWDQNKLHYALWSESFWERNLRNWMWISKEWQFIKENRNNRCRDSIISKSKYNKKKLQPVHLTHISRRRRPTVLEICFISSYCSIFSPGHGEKK